MGCSEVKTQSNHNVLSGQQQKRLNEYSSSLRRDRNEYLFDKGMLELLRAEVKDYKKLDSVRDHLRSINFSMSKKEAKQLQVQLDRFLEDNHKNVSTNPHFQEAKRLISESVSSGRLVRMMEYGDKDHLDSLSRTDTHSGFLYIETGVKSKGDYDKAELQQLFDDSVALARQTGTFDRPILIAYRTQGSGGFDADGNPTGPETRKWKTRFVSIVDLLVILAENQFAKPFMSKLRDSGFYAGAYSDHELTSKLTVARRQHDFWTSIDYSSYDQTISDWLIYEAFDIVEDCFMKDSFDDELWKAVKSDFVKKTFVDLDGRYVKSRKGIPSGSMFTQIIGTLVNRLMILTFMLSKGYSDPSRLPMFIMGDDNIFFTKEFVDPFELSSYLAYNFGVITHGSKCEQGTTREYPSFLSRIWTPEGADRQLEVVISKLLYPERWRDYVRTLNGLHTLNPEDILYSYCLAFPVAMTRLLKDRVEFMARYRATRGKTAEGREFASGLDRLRAIENLVRATA